MGAVGQAIFSDDVACDVRDAYKLLLDGGWTGVDATDLMLAEWLKDLSEVDGDALVFWLALAATQSQLGRLEDRVRDRALAIIDSGRDVVRWYEVGQEQRRQAVLLKLREQLVGPQPSPKRVRVEPMQLPDCQPGNYVSYQLNSGNQIILYVHAINDVHGVSYSALDFFGTTLPDPMTVAQLSIREPLDQRYMARYHGIFVFSLATFKKRDLPHKRLNVLPVSATELRPTRGSAVSWFWKDFDEWLDEFFGWK